MVGVRLSGVHSFAPILASPHRRSHPTPRRLPPRVRPAPPQGNSKCFSGMSVADAEAECCASAVCAGFSYMPADGSGCYKLDTNCGAVNSTNYVG